MPLRFLAGARAMGRMRWIWTGGIIIGSVLSTWPLAVACCCARVWPRVEFAEATNIDRGRWQRYLALPEDTLSASVVSLRSVGFDYRQLSESGRNVPHTLRTVEAGWPFHAFEGAGSSRPVRKEFSLVLVGKADVPTDPIWWGIAANSLATSLVVLSLIKLCRGIKRVVLLRRCGSTAGIGRPRPGDPVDTPPA